jgi:ubiquitin-conjugating enzyme E2 J1
MNVNNNAIKRIMADVKELAKHPSPRYSAAPLEQNVFEWHFSIRGPSETDFEGVLRLFAESKYLSSLS